jgi:Na+-transporting NADH:ubiquinone oxidoreductase subunit NqrC
MEVAGDPDDFMPVFSNLDKKGQIFKDIDKAIKELKKDKIVGTHLQRDKVSKYYIKKHDCNAYKVVLPENWRLIYGILSINEEKHALLMEVFDHVDYNIGFDFKKK